MEMLIALEARLYISGHGEPLQRADLEARLKQAVERRAQIARLVAAHKNLQEVKAALGDPPPKGLAKLFPTFTDTTYQELTRQ